MNLSLQDLKTPIAYWSSFLYGKVRSYAQPYVYTEFTASQVTDNLYIGDFPSACNQEELTKLGITHIVTVIVGVDEMFPDKFKYKLVDVCDNSTTDLYKYFDDCSKFIDEAIKGGGKVYIHCMAGRSRSATILAAYLIYKKKCTEDEAITIIKEKRDCVDPNPGFREQLKLYAEYIRNKEIP